MGRSELFYWKGKKKCEDRGKLRGNCTPCPSFVIFCVFLCHREEKYTFLCMDLTETLFRVKKNDLHFSLDLMIYEFLTRINVTNSAVSLNTRVIIGSGSILDLIGIWGVTQIWIGRGCATGSSRLIPMFRGNFSKNRYPYLGIFLCEPRKILIIRPIVRDFFMKNGTHV